MPICFLCWRAKPFAWTMLNTTGECRKSSLTTGNKQAKAVWTNSMFSGMPGYLISVNYPGNLGRKLSVFVRKTFSTASFIILYLVGFYILLSGLKINRWLCVAGAVALPFFLFLIIIGAGHMTKANAIAMACTNYWWSAAGFPGKTFGRRITLCCRFIHGTAFGTCKSPITVL